jgi:hypothetical protein
MTLRFKGQKDGFMKLHRRSPSRHGISARAQGIVNSHSMPRRDRTSPVYGYGACKPCKEAGKADACTGFTGNGWYRSICGHHYSMHADK